MGSETSPIESDAPLPPRTIAAGLAVAFFVFYLFQVPWTTTNQDVLIYAARSLSDAPIVETTYTRTEPAGNIHLGHTLILWAVYRFAPDYLRTTVWPAGFVSALAGCLTAALTFLIWLKLGLGRRLAVTVAIITGLIPSIWYHSLIGETYSLELCLLLAFFYFFLTGRWLAAIVAGTGALLVSLLIALSFPIVLLAPWTPTNVRRAAGVLLASGILFGLVLWAVTPEVFSSFLAFGGQTTSSSFGWLARFGRLGLVVLLNLSFLTGFFLKGCVILVKRHRHLVPGLAAIALGSQLFYLLTGAVGGVIEVGSFQLTLLWAGAAVIGIGLAASRLWSPGPVAAAAGFVLFGWWGWIFLGQGVALERLEAANWLKGQELGEVLFVGSGEAGVPIALEQYGWQYDRAVDHFSYITYPTGQDLLELDAERAVIVVSKRNHPTIRSMLVGLSEVFEDESWRPGVAVGQGILRRLYENSAVALYWWERHKAASAASRGPDPGGGGRPGRGPLQRQTVDA